jgi:hypothetical protein
VLRLLAKTSRLRLLMTVMWLRLVITLAMTLVMGLFMILIMVLSMVLLRPMVSVVLVMTLRMMMFVVTLMLRMGRAGLKITARLVLVLSFWLRGIKSRLLMVLGLVFGVRRCLQGLMKLTMVRLRFAYGWATNRNDVSSPWRLVFSFHKILDQLRGWGWSGSSSDLSRHRFRSINSVVTVVDCPPASGDFVKGRISFALIAALQPWLLGSYEMDQVDAWLEVLVRRDILVVGGWCDVVSEAQAVVRVLEVHVQETLVGTIEWDAAVGHGHHGIIVAHVWCQDHDAGVEQVGPPDVRGSGEGMWEVKELVGSSISNHVGIQVNNLPELRLPPQVDLGECRVQVWSVHQVQVGRPLVSDAHDRNHIVIDSLELGYDLSRDGVERHQNGELLLRTRIAQRVGEHECARKICIGQKKAGIHILPPLHGHFRAPR